MKANELISVALCTFNGEQYIKEQLDSLISQTYSNIEIIIVDDCSTDNTFEILKSYASRFAQILLSRNSQNLGFVKNFEKALSFCKGDYIAICDQDDIWRLDKLQLLKDEMQDFDLIFHDSLLIDKHGESIAGLKLSDKTEIYSGDSNLYFLTNNCISGHASLFKRSLLEYVIPFDRRFFYDWWIAFVASSIGKIKYIPEILVSYRQHDKNITDILITKKKDKKGQLGNKYMAFNLDWILYLTQFEYLKNSEEVKYIHSILSDLSNGIKGVPFAIFLLRYYNKLFNLKKKTFFSRLNLIRKVYYSDFLKHNTM